MTTNAWHTDFETLDWTKHLATEMRFRGADERQVHDAIATARAHCQDSGERPEVAIGDPVQTATDLVGRRTAPLSYACGTAFRQHWGYPPRWSSSTWLAVPSTPWSTHRGSCQSA
ncbi:hypothetical protein AAEX63_09815 [Luteococcus sp. H138]|uniref:hypothetical protein n=1 Tax=unclassified Luteococcus TaxID=2639923 RepID=UPI00313E6359